MFEPKKLKFGLNIRIIKGSCVPILGIHQGHVVVNKEQKKKNGKKREKTAILGSIIY